MVPPVIWLFMEKIQTNQFFQITKKAICEYKFTFENTRQVT